VLGTDWAIAVESILKAYVIVEDGKIDTTTTFCAMFVINPQAFTDTTEPTVLAVKNGLICIRKEVTDIAIVLGELLSTVLFAAILSTRLDLEAVHAHHLLDSVSVNLMLLLSIVAKATGVKAATAWRFYLGLTGVVCTAHDTLCFVLRKQRIW